LSGFCFSQATKSFSSLAGVALLATISSGLSTSSEIGSKSLRTS
jgi:hypothetical protein